MEKATHWIWTNPKFLSSLWHIFASFFCEVALPIKKDSATEMCLNGGWSCWPWLTFAHSVPEQGQELPWAVAFCCHLLWFASFWTWRWLSSWPGAEDSAFATGWALPSWHPSSLPFNSGSPGKIVGNDKLVIFMVLFQLAWTPTGTHHVKKPRFVFFPPH